MPRVDWRGHERRMTADLEGPEPSDPQMARAWWRDKIRLHHEQTGEWLMPKAGEWSKNLALGDVLREARRNGDYS
jgi:hypothetical protein